MVVLDCFLCNNNNNNKKDQSVEQKKTRIKKTKTGVTRFFFVQTCLKNGDRRSIPDIDWDRVPLFGTSYRTGSVPGDFEPARMRFTMQLQVFNK